MFADALLRLLVVIGHRRLPADALAQRRRRACSWPRGPSKSCQSPPKVCDSTPEPPGLGFRASLEAPAASAGRKSSPVGDRRALVKALKEEAPSRRDKSL